MLEQATTLDLADDFSGSQEVTAIARERLGELAAPPPGLALELAFAEARVTFRARRFPEAAAALQAVADAARAQHREDVETAAELLLGPSLVEAGELDQAREMFSQLIARLDARGDRFHLGAAYGNRAWLWSALGEVERNADDQRIAVQLAREVGHALLERAATYNLAEDRLWQGASDEAVRLARRSLALQQSHGEGASRFDRLLLARILAARLERRELGELLITLTTEDQPPDERIVLGVLSAVAEDADNARWETALAEVDTLDAAHRLELAHLAAITGHLSGDRRTDIIALASIDSIWSRRLTEF
ncbi:MAG: hypothetical protein WKG01_11700 [Kofleriaceae bacterium]